MLAVEHAAAWLLQMPAQVRVRAGLGARRAVHVTRLGGARSGLAAVLIATRTALIPDASPRLLASRLSAPASGPAPAPSFHL